MGGKVWVFTFRAELTTRTDPFTLFGSANGTCSCNICQAAKAARPFLTIEDLSHQPHLPPLLHFPAGPQQTLTFCDAWLPGCSLLLTSMHAPQNCHPAVLWNSVDTRVPLNAWLQLCPGSFERSSKSLCSPPPLSPFGTQGMLGNQELPGSPLPLPPPKTCLSSLATYLEYACAEDYIRMGTRGETHLLSHSLPVCKHPLQVSLAMAHGLQEQLSPMWLSTLHSKNCSLYFSWKLSTLNLTPLSKCHLQ